MSNTEELKRRVTAKRIEDKSSSPSAIRKDDTLVVLHKEELEFTIDSIYYRLIHDKDLSVDEKREAVHLLKHLEE